MAAIPISRTLRGGSLKSTAGKGRRSGPVFFFALMMAIAICGLAEGPGRKIQESQEGLTRWRILPSFKYDTLCLLNTLTGDPYYLTYYRDEHEELRSRLPAEVKDSLLNLKRKIKDEAKGIISAFLCLYFSATEGESLREMRETLEDSRRMRENLKRSPYYSEDS